MKASETVNEQLARFSDLFIIDVAQMLERRRRFFLHGDKNVCTAFNCTESS